MSEPSKDFEIKASAQGIKRMHLAVVGVLTVLAPAVFSQISGDKTISEVGQIASAQISQIRHDQDVIKNEMLRLNVKLEHLGDKVESVDTKVKGVRRYLETRDKKLMQDREFWGSRIHKRSTGS